VFARPVLILLAVVLLARALTATAHADSSEIEARKAYAAGHYKEAVDLYSNLYAATLHPTYLRNIGRCYQNLEEPQLAIKSYQEYLRKKANVTAAERREIEGFIAEMEALKTRQTAAATPTPTPMVPAPAAPAAPAVPAPPPAPRSAIVATPSPSGAQSSSSSIDLAARAPEPEAPSTPFYTRWWFWTLVGLAVAGGGAAVFLTRDGDGGGPSTDYGPYSPMWQ
jgi:tetratricopeptide (TPR) repeat protein